jgi:hypothetical protein
MRANVTRVKDLKAVLKDLESHVKTPDSLRKGRKFRNFSLLPREVLANLLICAVGNFEEGDEKRLTICTDPMGGDGLIFNQKTGKYMSTEHVFIPLIGDPRAQAVEDRILGALAHKNKKGARYATGKDLIVFSEARGLWFPNWVARRIVGGHAFETVWVVHLEKVDAGEYFYNVTCLDASVGNAPTWSIILNSDFRNWRVERIQ